MATTTSEGMVIFAYVCFALGGVLIIAGCIYLVVWAFCRKYLCCRKPTTKKDQMEVGHAKYMDHTLSGTGTASAQDGDTESLSYEGHTFLPRDDTVGDPNQNEGDRASPNTRMHIENERHPVPRANGVAGGSHRGSQVVDHDDLTTDDTHQLIEKRSSPKRMSRDSETSREERSSKRTSNVLAGAAAATTIAAVGATVVSVVATRKGSEDSGQQELLQNEQDQSFEDETHSVVDIQHRGSDVEERSSYQDTTDSKRDSFATEERKETGETYDSTGHFDDDVVESPDGVTQISIENEDDYGEEVHARESYNDVRSSVAAGSINEAFENHEEYQPRESYHESETVSNTDINREFDRSDEHEDEHSTHDDAEGSKFGLSHVVMAAGGLTAVAGTAAAFSNRRASGEDEDDNQLDEHVENIEYDTPEENREFVQSEENREFVQPEENREFVQSEENREFGQSEENREFGQSEENQEFVQSEENQEFVQSEENREFVQPEENREFEQSEENREFFQTEENTDYHQSDENIEHHQSEDNNELYHQSHEEEEEVVSRDEDREEESGFGFGHAAMGAGGLAAIGATAAAYISRRKSDGSQESVSRSSVRSENIKQAEEINEFGSHDTRGSYLDESRQAYDDSVEVSSPGVAKEVAAYDNADPGFVHDDRTSQSSQAHESFAVEEVAYQRESIMDSDHERESTQDLGGGVQKEVVDQFETQNNMEMERTEGESKVVEAGVLEQDTGERSEVVATSDREEHIDKENVSALAMGMSVVGLKGKKIRKAKKKGRGTLDIFKTSDVDSSQEAEKETSTQTKVIEEDNAVVMASDKKSSKRRSKEVSKKEKKLSKRERSKKEKELKEDTKSSDKKKRSWFGFRKSKRDSKQEVIEEKGNRDVIIPAVVAAAGGGTAVVATVMASKTGDDSEDIVHIDKTGEEDTLQSVRDLDDDMPGHVTNKHLLKEKSEEEDSLVLADSPRPGARSSPLMYEAEDEEDAEENMAIASPVKGEGAKEGYLSKDDEGYQTFEHDGDSSSHGHPDHAVSDTEAPVLVHHVDDTSENDQDRNQDEMAFEQDNDSEHERRTPSPVVAEQEEHVEAADDNVYSSETMAEDTGRESPVLDDTSYEDRRRHSRDNEDAAYDIDRRSEVEDTVDQEEAGRSSSLVHDTSYQDEDRRDSMNVHDTSYQEEAARSSTIEDKYDDVGRGSFVEDKYDDVGRGSFVEDKYDDVGRGSFVEDKYDDVGRGSFVEDKYDDVGRGSMVIDEDNVQHSSEYERNWASSDQGRGQGQTMATAAVISSGLFAASRYNKDDSDKDDGEPISKSILADIRDQTGRKQLRQVETKPEVKGENDVTLFDELHTVISAKRVEDGHKIFESLDESQAQVQSKANEHLEEEYDISTFNVRARASLFEGLAKKTQDETVVKTEPADKPQSGVAKAALQRYQESLKKDEESAKQSEARDKVGSVHDREILESDHEDEATPKYDVDETSREEVEMRSTPHYEDNDVSERASQVSSVVTERRQDVGDEDEAEVWRRSALSTGSTQEHPGSSETEYNMENDDVDDTGSGIIPRGHVSETVAAHESRENAENEMQETVRQVRFSPDVSDDDLEDDLD